MSNIIATTEAPQGGEKWFELRRGIPTASCFSRIMDAEFNLKQPKTVKAKEAGELNDAVFTYACELVAERFRGPMLDYQSEAKFQGSWATEQGKILEPVARSWFELEFDCDILEVAFIQTDDKKCGCSPDGLVGEDSGLELKCPQGVNQVKYLLEGVLPPEYLHQAHGSLFVSGRASWHFLSYNETLPNPAFHILVERDEAIMQRIGKSIQQFCQIVDRLEKQLKPK
jgi:hypothetical protein